MVCGSVSTYKERRRSRFSVANTLQATFSGSSVQRVRVRTPDVKSRASVDLALAESRCVRGTEVCGDGGEHLGEVLVTVNARVNAAGRLRVPECESTGLRTTVSAPNVLVVKYVYVRVHTAGDSRVCTPLM
jgi:hypothetical protein